MNNRGSVLFSILWLILFFSAAVSVIGIRVGSKIFMIQKTTEKAALRMASHSGITFAQQTVRQYYDKENPEEEAPPFSENWFGDSAFPNSIMLDENQSFKIGHLDPGHADHEIVFLPGMEDETGRLNINYATQSVLEKIYLFGNILTPDVSAELAKKTIECRDRKLSFAASINPEYQGGALIGSVDEWLTLPGMPLALWKALRGHVTVFGSGKVNLNAVSKETLVILGISSSLADRIVTYRKSVDCASADLCEPAFLDLGNLTQKIGVNSEDYAELQNLAALWTFSPEVFRFVSIASDKNRKGTGAVECVIDKKGSILFLKEI